ncbi:ATP-binding cassette domain-containing protein [Carnobacterium gallinarum]|uniref:ATP-binding cassette domain-containing protein n=1 Tax=Carnobacterium gallinarum TaxID=2749 RepID=UPI00055791F1|nr:ATP-binding cassette domain-containing protein [Carnobacterium gallinarum]
MTDILLEVNNLTKELNGKEVFNPVTFSIKKGTLTTIHGVSGSGKTTLLNILGLNETYSTGSYSLFGQTTSGLSTHKKLLLKRKNLAFLFQNYGLVEEESIDYNLDIGLKYKKLTKKAKQQEKETALKKVGILYRPTKKVYELSGGEKQRVALARALIKPNEIIFADEPTGSLDTENRNKIVELLLEQTTLGKTVILVSHDDYLIQKSTQVIQLT